jgi:hypothetical protein
MFDKYSFKTKKGTVYIASFRKEFVVLMKNHNLGTYKTPQDAIDALTTNKADTSELGFDTSSLGLPAVLAEWRYQRSE